jgi:hypothetical protein
MISHDESEERSVLSQDAEASSLSLVGSGGARDLSIALSDLYKSLPLDAVTAMSRKERKDNNYNSSCLVYGEISYEPFTAVIIAISEESRH